MGMGARWAQLNSTGSKVTRQQNQVDEPGATPPPAVDGPHDVISETTNSSIGGRRDGILRRITALQDQTLRTPCANHGADARHHRGAVTSVITMTQTGGTLRFSSPPVRGVALTVFFAPIEGLLLTSLAPLVAEVRKGFPVVKERFPEMPWAYEDLDDDEPFPLPDSNTFPFPYLSFANGSGHSINFQSDRFRLTWSFSDDEDYPGFDELMSQLGEHLDHFVRHIDNELGAQLAVSHVAVRYDNELGADASPAHVMLRAYGVNEGEFNLGSDALRLQEETFHATIPQFADERIEDVYLISRRLEDGTTLGLRSTARRLEPSNEDWRELLIAAHDNLIEVFRRVTSPAQKSQWGVIE